MKILKNETVFEAALDRIRTIYDEFDNVVIGFSGGKDSTVVLNLAIQVAKEKDRLPIKVMFTDQEAEWQTVIDYIRTVKDRPEVDMDWLQIPIQISNGTSYTDLWLQCWEPGSDWLREKEPDSIHDNVYGTKTFAELFKNYFQVTYGDEPAAYIAGVRAEESPARYTALTSTPKYKWITWAKTLNKKQPHITFYPLYDWSYTDVWKAIHDNKWEYCKIYDYQYQHGLVVKDMRVSNVHHETAMKSLYYMQEVERDTWDKLTKRIHGISTAGQLKDIMHQCPKELPYMFSSWREYRDHLLEHLTQLDDVREKFRKEFARMDKLYKNMQSKDDMYKVHITAIMTNDYHMTKIHNWERNPLVHDFRNYDRFGQITKNTLKNKYVNG